MSAKRTLLALMALAAAAVLCACTAPAPAPDDATPAVSSPGTTESGESGLEGDAIATPDSTPERQPMRLYTAELTEEEEDVLLSADGRITNNYAFDYAVDESVQEIELSVCKLEDGAWKTLCSFQVPCAHPNGRIELVFSYLTKEVGVTLQNEEGADVSRTLSWTEEDDAGTAGIAQMTVPATDGTELCYGKKQALAIQVIASGEQTVVFGAESFDRPEELAQQGYDAVYAVAVEFFDQTEEGETPSLSSAP